MLKLLCNMACRFLQDSAILTVLWKCIIYTYGAPHSNQICGVPHWTVKHLNGQWQTRESGKSDKSGCVYHMPQSYKALLGRGQMCGPGHSPLHSGLLTRSIGPLLFNMKLCLERLAASLHTTHCDWWHLGDLAPSPQKLQRKRHCCSGEINTCRQITCCSRETALGHFIFLRHHKVRIMCVLC